MTGETDPQKILSAMNSQYPDSKVVLTLGEQGAWYAEHGETVFQEAIPAKAVDTTAAGDTFTGYFLAAMNVGFCPLECLLSAAKASSLTVSRNGAAQSIPYLNEIA